MAERDIALTTNILDLPLAAAIDAAAWPPTAPEPVPRDVPSSTQPPIYRPAVIGLLM